MREYTIGEIYRLGLLTGRYGPYKGKGEVSRALRTLPHTVKDTKHGPAKIYTEETIAKWHEGRNSG